MDSESSPGAEDRFRGNRSDSRTASAAAADDRDASAADRDRRASSHDEASTARDERADARDERAEIRDQDVNESDSGAASDRASALRDRQGSASDRGQAADDRNASALDRVLSARERASLAVDHLTRAYVREVGLAEITREFVRAQRTKRGFVLAFIDIDGLKLRNDSLGHQAGDQLLCDVAAAFRARFRAYDLLVRYGGDEFVCGISEMTVDEASSRFERMNAELLANHQASVSFGLADLLGTDNVVEQLIARADVALYAQRQLRSSTA